MKMKVGLIDIDSKIPNLALMKLSQYHKQLGHQIEMTSPLFANQNGYDLLVASKIFDYTSMPILPKDTQIGGSGYDLKKKLIEPIDHIYPDYDLYGCDYAIGYTSRGCNRGCPFCIVPKKEGKWKKVADLNEFWRGQDRVMLLDNSINTNQEHFIGVARQLRDNKIKTDFNQGLDIRYLTNIQAHYLKQVPLWKQIHFAWDFMRTEKAVRTGIEILGKYKLKYKSMFYVLIGYNTTQEEDLYRVETLRGLSIDPFVMPYDKDNSYQRNFARWVNHKAIFKSMSWENYDRTARL